MSIIRHNSQVGFSLISAIFLLVVLASLGVVMVRFSNVQHMTSAQDVEGARVYRLVQGGVDYGVYQVLQNGGACPASVNLSFSGGYAATVNCALEGPYAEPGGSVSVYTITSTACNQPASGGCPGVPNGLSYVERRVSAVLTR